MTIKEFDKVLYKKLKNLKVKNREDIVKYYHECIFDRMEEGFSESEAIATLEPIESIVANLGEMEVENTQDKKYKKAFYTTLLIVTSIIWIPLLVGVVALFAGIIALLVVLYVLPILLVIIGALGFVLSIYMIISSSLIDFLIYLAIGFVATGLGLLLAVVLLKLLKYIKKGLVNIFHFIKKKIKSLSKGGMNYEEK